MASPADQGARDDGYISRRRQTAGSFRVPQDCVTTSTDPDLMYPENVGSNFMMQTPVQMDHWIRSACSNHINNPTANRNEAQGYIHASTPRGGAAMQQIESLFDLNLQMIGDSIEPQSLEKNRCFDDKGPNEPGYIMDAKLPYVSKQVSEIPNPDAEEWERWKMVIRSLYVDKNYNCDQTRKEMAKKCNFHAKNWMYKKMFRVWRSKDPSWGTYTLDKASGTSGRGRSNKTPKKRTRKKAAGPSNTETSHPNGSRDTTVFTSTPIHLGREQSQFIHSNSALFENTTFSLAKLSPTQSEYTYSDQITPLEKNSQLSSSNSSTTAASTPPHLAHTHSPSTHSNSPLPNNTTFLSQKLSSAQPIHTILNPGALGEESWQPSSSHPFTTATSSVLCPNLLHSQPMQPSSVLSNNTTGYPSYPYPTQSTSAQSNPNALHKGIWQPSSSYNITMVASSPPYTTRVSSQSIHSDSTQSDNTAGSPSYVYPEQSTLMQSNFSALSDQTLRTNRPHGSTVIVSTPPHNNSPHSSTTIPASMSDTDFDKLMVTILGKTSDLCISYQGQNKWMVMKQREVEEDIHDDLLVGIATSTRNYNTLSRDVGSAGFEEALKTLEKVVGVKKGADCGLFSLPAIWISFLRLIREKRLIWASEFLSQALSLAVNKFGFHHPLVLVLRNIGDIWLIDRTQIEEVVLMAYLSYIGDVAKTLDSFNLTYLSLWADYVVYVDGTSMNQTHKVVKNIRGLIKVLEEEKGPDGGPDSDYILELFGLMLYILQSNLSDPVMATEAEKVAEELLRRLERRKQKAGGKLEGDLFTTWKDLRQTLGTLCQNRKDYVNAIRYLEEFLEDEIVDDRDALAYKKLVECYSAVGGYEEEIEKVWKLRREYSEGKLEKTNTKLDKDECEDVREEAESDGEEGSNEEEETSDGTAVDQIEEMDKESLEEDDDADDADESEDCEVERQLLREQIAELNKRLNVLAAGKETTKKGAKVVT